MASLSQAPRLGDLPSPHGAFQEHAAHRARWPARLSSKGSWGPCRPQSIAAFLHYAFTAHRVRWVPLVPSFQRLGAFALSPHPSVRGFPTRRLLCPCRLFLRALAFRWGLPYLLPARLPIPQEVSRVPYGGLKQDGLGGALSTVPSTLCGSPDVAWSKDRFIHALFHRAYGGTRCRAYCCTMDSFGWSGWHLRQGLPGA
jgi:hypothetical protein